MRQTLRRIGQDLRHRRNIDAYVVATAAIALAVLSLAGDLAPDSVRWAALLAAVAVLVYHVTIPAGVSGADVILNDRSDFDETPFPVRLRTARSVCIWAPSAGNLLSGQHVEALRNHVLKRGGSVRVVVLDPSREEVVRLVTRHLDDAEGFETQDFPSGLGAILGRLRAMAGWQVSGTFEYRLLDFNPGFSLIGVDIDTAHGVVIVEFHGYRNEGTTSRMHVELTRKDSERWYTYWCEQFEHIWRSAHPAPVP